MIEPAKEIKINARYDWVDVLKALGIIAIYVGHYGNDAGRLYPFVFAYHVPLFFFVAGFFSDLKKDESFGAYLKKQLLRLMVPYIGFALLSLVIYAIEYNSSTTGILRMLSQIPSGTRNNIFASSLWFIPCLFVMSVMYNLSMRILKKKSLALVFSLFLFSITQTVLPNNPINTPSLFMNIDSAMYYIVYYALGAIVFPKIKDFRFESLGNIQKISFVFFSLLAIAVTAITYIQGRTYIFQFIDFQHIVLLSSLFAVFLAIICIYSNILLAYALRKVLFLQSLGRNTLILCGTEQIAKLLLENLTSIFGLSLSLNSQMNILIYVMICFVVSYHTFVKFINRFVPWMAGKATIPPGFFSFFKRVHSKLQKTA